jgi:hypothetical protein
MEILPRGRGGEMLKFWLEGFLQKVNEVYGQTNPVGAETGGGWGGGARSVPRARDQYGDSVQAAYQVWRDGRVADDTD